MNIINQVKKSIELKASDIHITEGMPYKHRIDGSLVVADIENNIVSSDVLMILISILKIDLKSDVYSMDCSRDIDGIRVRINIYRSNHGIEIAIRVLSDVIPHIGSLGLPKQIVNLTKIQKGLIVISGTTGSGKTTTAFSLLNEINKEREGHIITIEDPIEYLLTGDKCKVAQREVGTHVESFQEATRDAMREDPDIIFLGELRDRVTIQNALTNSETGHLVIATIHSRNIVEVVDRVVDMFEPIQQSQIRNQFCNVLSASVNQALVKKCGQGRYCLTETLIVDSSIRNLLRQNKDVNSVRNLINSGSNSETIVDSAIRGIVDGNVMLSEMIKYLSGVDLSSMKVRLERAGIDTSEIEVE